MPESKSLIDRWAEDDVPFRILQEAEAEDEEEQEEEGGAGEQAE